MSCPSTRHYCENKEHRQEDVRFCQVSNPGSIARCARFSGHDGDHSGYAFAVSTRETWPA